MRQPALRFVVLLGVVSLFADMTYEGARSITGPYLHSLGASATFVGIVVGLGELLGYGLRLVSGRLADRSGRYWSLANSGYLLNLLSVPLIGITGKLLPAAGFMLLERTGKAIRTPARDTMLAHATAEIGRGFGFGLHEALDQTGALIGPLLVALVLHLAGEYAVAFGVLFIPAILSLATLVVAQRVYHTVVGPTAPHAGALPPLPASFWWCLAGAGLIAAGYADFPLIAFHFARAALVPDSWIPVGYAAAMGVAGLAALLLGRWYDRLGRGVLGAAALATAAFAPLAFLGGRAAALAGVLLWGIGLGVQQSIFRALVASIVPPARRASAFGLFDAGFGISWFLGSVLLGILYDVTPAALVAFSITAQVAGIPLLLRAAAPLPQES
jgi:MFS family permease